MRLSYFVGSFSVAALAAGCTTPPSPSPAPRDVTVSHWYQVVPRAPDVAAYPALPEHVLAVPQRDRNFVVVRVSTYAKQRSFPAPSFSSVSLTPPAAPPKAKQPAIETQEQTFLFAFDSDKLDRQSLDKLQSFIGSLPLSRGDVHVSISTHTDSRGSDEYNLRLSTRRADYVKSVVVSHGIPSGNVSLSPRGEAQPVASNNTEEGRRLNRRAVVEMKGAQ